MTVIRPARPEDAATLAWFAALTFPLACPPGSDPAAVARHITDKLSPAVFAGWATDPTAALLVAEPAADEPSPGEPSPGEPGAGEPGAGESTEFTTPLGYALVLTTPPEDPDIRRAVGPDPGAELSKIYVHPDAHGSTVAAELMAAALAAARRLLADRNGAASPRIWLGTNADNARARGFYLRSGFAVVGMRTFVVGGERHADVVLARAL